MSSARAALSLPMTASCKRAGNLKPQVAEDRSGRSQQDHETLRPVESKSGRRGRAGRREQPCGTSPVGGSGVAAVARPGCCADRRWSDPRRQSRPSRWSLPGSCRFNPPPPWRGLADASTPSPTGRRRSSGQTMRTISTSAGKQKSELTRRKTIAESAENVADRRSLF